MTAKRRKTMVAVMTALALVLGGCSSETDPNTNAQGDGTRLGNKDGKKGAKGKKRPGAKKGRAKARSGQKAGTGNIPGPGKTSPAPAKGGEAAPSGGGFASQGPPSPVDPSLANRSASVDDPDSDAKKEGALVPAYAELIGAGVQGLGEQFEMIFRFNGNVPQKTDDKNTIMVIGFGISAGGNETYGFTAQGNQDGWKAYAGAKDGARKFPGQFLIEGNEIIMRVPWKFINGPRRFKWQASTTWFRTVANTTHYSFDQCPDKESADFPN